MAEPLERLTAALADRYRIERELGAGGMATVYLAEDLRHHRKVAVKVLRPDLAASLGPDRFLREVTIAANLTHPHILPVHDSGEVDGFLYYVMPYVEGISLRQKLAREGELPIPEAVRILRDIADALAQAHHQGVVHRDIKPENVMLVERHALVMDFGVAKAVAAGQAPGATGLTSAGVALGTPAYMAPEQATGETHVDHRADLYAWGIVAYELLAGQPPFVRTTPQNTLAAQVTATPEPVTQHRANVPGPLARLVMQCLEKKAADRPQSAEEVLRRLDQVLMPTMTTPHATEPVQLAAPRPAAHPVRVAGLFALASVGVLTLVHFVVRAAGLPDWVFHGAVGLLAATLPFMLVSSWRERRRAKLARTGVHQEAPVGWERHLTVKKTTLGGVLAFLALMLATGGFMVSRVVGIGPGATLLSSGVLQDQDRLVLADLANATSDSTIGETVTELLRVSLAQSRKVELVEQTQVGDVLERMKQPRDVAVTDEVAREIATRLGLKAYVTGEVRGVGSGFLLSARLIEAGTGNSLVTVSEAVADAGELIEAVNTLANGLREKIGESLRMVRADPPLESVTTNSFEAIRIAAQALKVTDRGEWDQAIALLQRAIAIDSTFTSAHRRLGWLFSNRGSRDSAVVHMERAYSLREKLSVRERLLVEAGHASVVRDDPEAALAAYVALLAEYPNEPVALNNAAGAAVALNRMDEALGLYRRAIATGTAYSVSYAGFILNLLSMGEMAAADTALGLFAERFPEFLDLPWFRSNLALARSDFAGAAAAVQVLLSGSPAQQSLGNSRLALVADIEGRRREAERLYRKVLTINARRLRWSADRLALNEGISVMRRSFDFQPTDPGEVERLWALNQRVTAGRPARDRNYYFFADAFTRSGLPARARAVVEEFRKGLAAIERPLPLDQYSLLLADAEVTAAEGRLAGALQLFRQGCDLVRGRYAFCNAHPDEARLLQKAGATDSAVAVLQRYFALEGERPSGWAPQYAAHLRRLGELLETTGERAKAIEVYRRFVDLWKNADPELQPIVKDAKERIARLVEQAG